MEKVKPVFKGALAQSMNVWKVLLLVYVPIVLMFLMLHTISSSTEGITLSYFTRDISAIGNMPFFAGLVSQIGGLLWSAAITVCIFALFILRKQGRGTRSAIQFLIQAAVLTCVLLLDDFFLFHEDIGPDYLNIGEKTIVLVYLLLTAAFLFLNIREILASEYLLLTLALIWFGISIFLDAANLNKYDSYGFFFGEQFQIFLEDGFKFVGVATWLVYFARYGYHRITASNPGMEARP